MVEEAAIARMVQAGIIPMTWVGVGAELLVDWRSATGQAHGKLMADYLPFSGNNFVGFLAQARDRSVGYPGMKATCPKLATLG